jgi:hypothetical protein
MSAPVDSSGEPLEAGHCVKGPAPQISVALEPARLRDFMTNDALIFLVEALHTAVFGFASACVVYGLRCGVTGRASAWLLRSCIAIPTGVGLLWLLNGHECVLSSVIYRLSGGDRAVPDILLPTCFARWIMTGATPVLCFGVALVLWREIAQEWRPKAAREPPWRD